MESLNTSITTAELCRKYGGTPVTVTAWKDKFFQGGEDGAGSREHQEGRRVAQEAGQGVGTEAPPYTDSVQKTPRTKQQNPSNIMTHTAA